MFLEKKKRDVQMNFFDRSQENGQGTNDDQCHISSALPQ